MSPFSSWFLIVTLIYEREALRVQKLSVFSENCCKGKSENYESNVRNLEDVSMTVSRGHMKSFSIHHGLWALSLGVNHTKGGIYYEGNNDDVHGNCGSSASAGGGSYIQYKSIRYVGNLHLSLPGLSLFTGESFQGEELYFDGANLRLPSPYVFKSYGFTGKEHWTVFPLTNFSGAAGPSCLIAQNKMVSYAQKGPPVALASLQRGCSKRGKENGKKLPAKGKTTVLHAHQALILYLERNQTGERIYTDGLELRLPIPLHFKSHSFVGNKNWTVSSGTEPTGPGVTSLCLHNPKSSSAANGKWNGKALTSMAVGSVRRGCDSDPVKELITPPPETHEQQVDATGGASAPLYLDPLQLANFLPLPLTLIPPLFFLFN